MSIDPPVNLDQEDPEAGCVSHTKSHFEHAEEVEDLVNRILGPEVETSNDALQRLNEIFDVYQEQSHLLDPYLEKLVVKVVAKLREHVDLWSSNQTSLQLCHILFRYLYLLTKTRGYKTVVKFMSHEVTDLEPILDFLCAMRDPSVPWETRYICFLWLSLICMIPFDLKKVDSSTNKYSQASLVVRMIDVCKEYIRSTGKERDAASILIARLLSRRDVCDDHLVPFIEWSKSRLPTDADVFETAGILSSLCNLYKYAARETMTPTLDHNVMPLLTMSFFEKYDNNALIRKLRIKLTQRVGLCYLKPKIAPWRYQRGNRSLRQNLAGKSVVAQSNDTAQNEQEVAEDEEDIPDNLEIVVDILLNGLRDKDTIVRWSAAKGIGRITQRLPRELAEDVIAYLLDLFHENSLTNPLTGKLDLSAVSDSTWHGASLAVAELARRGLLLPERLEQTIPWIILALKFDLKRGSHSIGSHVRDAACYVCWSFARAYAPSVLEPFVDHIARNLVIVSVFDREINVRRASSAAFQENVGRQGIFPRGIDIIQLADYFAVGNRNNAFLDVAFEIAKFDEYRYHLIDHLVSTTIKHWDKAMRILASQTLYRLVPLDPAYFIDRTLPDLIPLTTTNDMLIQHGAMLAVAEICLALYECRRNNVDLDNYWCSKGNLMEKIATIVAKLPPKSLVTFGSEHIREAVCRLIECLATTNLPVYDYQHKSTLATWKDVVDSSLERKEENVRDHAVAAYGALAATYGIEESEVKSCLEKIGTSRHLYGRRGYAIALGTLNYSIPERRSWLPDVLRQLCMASRVQQEQQANDAEAKRNAVTGLKMIIDGLGDGFKSAVSSDDFLMVLNTLIACLGDYSTDQRGDVGSWVRVAAMECFQCLIPRVARLDAVASPRYLTETDTGRVIAGLLKQSVERIDRVRVCAGTVLCDLVCDEQITQLLDIPCRNILDKYITRELSWSAPAELYPVMTRILEAPVYRFELLSGLVASAGGLTESLVRHSSSCLVDFMNDLPDKNDVPDDALSLDVIAYTLLDIYRKYEKQDRVIIPLLDVTGLLYESGTLGRIQDSTFHEKLVVCTRKEVFKSKNIRKLLAAIKVYVGLIALRNTQAKTKALQQLLSYLVHSFPRIRTEASDQLYTYISVLNEEEINDGTLEAEEILTGTDWSGPLSEIKPIRDKLYSLLDIPKPVFKSA